MIDFFLVLAFSLVPWIEAKGAILYGYYKSLFFPYVFLIAVGTNLLAIPLVYLLWEKSLIPNFIRNWLERKLKKDMKKAEKWFSRWGTPALIILYGIPFSGFGLYTGIFTGEMMALSKKQVYVAAAFGMLLEVGLTMLSLFPVVDFLRPLLSFYETDISRLLGL